MTSHGQVAAGVRALKERSPSDFCPNPRCLWRVRKYHGLTDSYVEVPCPKHMKGDARV